MRGKLRKSGKVITTFHYEHQGQRIEFELRLQKRPGSEKIEYRVQHDEPKIDLTGSDPEDLRKRVLAEAERLLTITWERMLVIITDSDMDEGRADDAEMLSHISTLFQIESKIEVQFYEFGTTTAGAKVHRRMCGDGSKYGIEKGWPHELSSRHYEGTFKSASYVPWTDDNVKRLMAIRSGYQRMAAMLSELLGQDRAQHTLENVKLLGLPSPPEKASK